VAYSENTRDQEGEVRNSGKKTHKKKAVDVIRTGEI